MISYRLQNIVLPIPTVCMENSMYYRLKGDVLQEKKDLCFARHASCDFSTYFNAFSLNKWKAYAGIENVSLRLCLEGSFEVRVYAADWYRHRVQTTCLVSQKVVGDGTKETVLKIPETSGANLYFSLYALTEGARFHGGSYVTDMEESRLRPVEIDLVMCTFRREKFVERNIRLLEEHFLQSDAYYGARHFHVRIIDNGQTLPPSITQGDARIRLYPNLNVGGAGGFTRGMMESLQEGRATHILFMDDDVTIQVEALERTYNLLSLLKKEYQDRFLSGAMIRLDQPSWQNSAGEFVAGTVLTPIKGPTNLSHYRNVLFNEKYEEFPREYAAWWYCCIPVGIARLDNLPLPFFVRYDDVEYSVRNTKHILLLNGISVWHAPFDRKYSSLMEDYFTIRNNLVMMNLHHIVGRLGAVKYAMRRWMRNVVRYDYAAAELMMDGLEKFLQGPEFLLHNDPVQDLKEHAAKQTKLRPLNQLGEDVLSYAAFRSALKKDQESKCEKWIRFLTLNGHFLPNACFSPKGYAEYGYTANSKNFYRYRKILACNLNFEEGVLLEMDRKRCFLDFCRGLKDFCKLFFGWKTLQKRYEGAFREMTSENFWRKYLKLDENDRQENAYE